MAETEGFSYQYPIYTDNGEVDMDASRRVELNFVLKTEFSEEKKEVEASAPTGEPSKTARGVNANPNFKSIDTADYDNIVDQHLSVGSPVLLVGDTTQFYTVKRSDTYDGSKEVYTVADSSVGSVISQDESIGSSSSFKYYFKAEKPGKTRVDVLCPGAAVL